MKAVILAGGLGSRLSELTRNVPKPMVEIGGKPILWHIMQIYAYHGVTEFVLALGYKAESIKEYFLNLEAFNSNITLDLINGKTIIHSGNQLKWRIHLVDTGLQTQTGGRLKRLKKWIGNETFMLTYGDGLADINIKELVQFHQTQKRLATVTAIAPPAHFGRLIIEQEEVREFAEKNQDKETPISGGFFVFEPDVFDLIDNDQTSLEKEPLEYLAKNKQLAAYKHLGFWQSMDTLREHNILESLWQSGNAPWKIWEEF